MDRFGNNLIIKGKLGADKIETDRIETENVKTDGIQTKYIKTGRLVPYEGNINHNYFWLQNKDDGAYLLPRANNTCGIGNSTYRLDDLYVHGKVAYD